MSLTKVGAPESEDAGTSAETDSQTPFLLALTSAISTSDGGAAGGSGRTPLPSGRTPLPSAPTSQPAPVTCSSPQPDASHKIDHEERKDEEKGKKKDDGKHPVTLDDIVRLEHAERALLSDFFILRGIFLPKHRQIHHRDVRTFEKWGHTTDGATAFYSWEERVSDLRSAMEKRLRKQAKESSDSEEDWSEAMTWELEEFMSLFKQYENCKRGLVNIRSKCEKRHAGENGYYKYEVAKGVVYAVIGNQEKPPATKKKKFTPPVYSDASSPASNTPSKAPNGKKRKAPSGLANGRKSTAHLAKKVKLTMGTSSRQQRDAASSFASGPLTNIGRSIGNVPERPRTIEDIDREIDWTQEQIDRFTQNMMNLRLEKVLLERGDGVHDSFHC